MKVNGYTFPNEEGISLFFFTAYFVVLVVSLIFNGAGKRRNTPGTLCFICSFSPPCS
jgi:hypothetical protein